MTMDTHLLSFLNEKTKKPKPNHSQLSMLTVVIPSYCRQDFIVRQCAYWHGSGATAVIMDGSPHPLDLEMQKFINGLSDITYVHSKTTFAERLKRGGELVQTLYSVMCGDDEFLLFSGLCSAITLLEQDKDLVACIGQSLHFYLSSNGEKCSYGTGYSTFRYEIRHEDAQDRLNAMLTNYNGATCYAVTRSNVWCRSWGNLGDYSSAYMLEFDQAFSTYIWGKFASVDDVYWMRSSENSFVQTPDANRYLYTKDWWNSIEYKTENVNFITKLGAELVNAQHIEPAKAEAIVIGVMDVYEQAQLKHRIKALPFQQKCRVLALNRLKDWLPERLVNLLKQLRRWRTNQLRSRRTNQLSSRPKTFLLKATVTGNYGALSDLSKTKDNLPFLLNDALVSELLAMEELMADFYLARGKQSE